ncbi:trypsin-like serine protease [Cryobacterium adonitolivorans]|uniref:Trypsin-like serine protease n=1 Tax=Cryobacterium adonitolivorans TaxID=1259189 RepID=A0A4R8WDE9_9MICO|nr:trypsin-like peptidase domain-containing protein [Cryobacterium adonitolivorans]TFC04530.1 trypsin-like serine protease [Cryobacterium adonitolivorans]
MSESHQHHPRWRTGDVVAMGLAAALVVGASGTGLFAAGRARESTTAPTATTRTDTTSQADIATPVGTDATDDLTGLIEVDADIESGESGGPLYDADGEVIGIDTAASSGTTPITGYAIPIEDALEVVSAIDATITAVDGTAVATATALSAALAGHDPGNTVTIDWVDAAGTAQSAATLIAGPVG